MEQLEVYAGGDAPINVFMAPVVSTVAPGASLRDVAVNLAESEVGALVVTDGDEPVGIISERDVVRALAAGADPLAATAAEWSSARLVWSGPSATVAEVGARMMTEYVRHVLIGRPGRLEGIVSARDIVGAYAAE